jgi:hypothetical protein
MKLQLASSPAMDILNELPEMGRELDEEPLAQGV